MVGDYMLTEQPYWTAQFETITEAIPAARIQHEHFLKKHDPLKLYTFIQKVNEVEKVYFLIYDGREYDDPTTATIKADELLGTE
jgi:hypothetical protein